MKFPKPLENRVEILYNKNKDIHLFDNPLKAETQEKLIHYIGSAIDKGENAI